MCVKVITMTLRILLLWLAAGALRGTRTYPNPWRAFLFCLPFIPFFIALSIAFQNKDVWIMKLIRVHIDERSTNKKECFM